MKNSCKRSLKIVWVGIQAVLCIIQVTLAGHSISWGIFSRNVPSFIYFCEESCEDFGYRIFFLVYNTVFKEKVTHIKYYYSLLLFGC